jgi:hypothetical protein
MRCIYARPTFSSKYGTPVIEIRIESGGDSHLDLSPDTALAFAEDLMAQVLTMKLKEAMS